MEKKTPHKGFYILPNLFTAASMLSAFMCIVYCFKGQYHAGALAIFASAFLDGLDGKIARLTNTQSEFGVQFDSLADLVAFGVAPAVLAWSWQLQSFGRIGVGIAFLFVICAALRLARFNVNVGVVSKKFFIGLPSPAAGCTLAAFVLFLPYLPDFITRYISQITFVICIIVPLLMVSRVRYFSFKEFGFVKQYPFRVLLGSIFCMILLFSNPRFWLFNAIWLYLLGGILYTYVYLPHRNNKIIRKLKMSGD